MSTTICTGQPEEAALKGETMGVASLATKRHLESPMDGDEVVSPKIAKIMTQNNNNTSTQNNNISSEVLMGCGEETHVGQNSVQDSNGGDNNSPTSNSNNSSELVTTSILARTLLTTSSSGSSSLVGAAQYSGADPLESLKSSLEALPAPAILDSPSGSYMTSSLSKTTIVQGDSGTTSSSTSLVGFGSLLGPERCGPLAQAVQTVLSPIDEDPIEWTNPAKATPVVNGIACHTPHHGMNPSISSLTSLVDHQLQQQLSGGGSCGGLSPHHEVITEDENGKSYFNLGSTQESTILARKTSISGSSVDGGWGSGGSCAGGGGAGNNQDFDDAISSSSCDSISSEDLFNSGEEFDASDDEDEDELCTYKQQRSTVLHLSLCKLNKFRTNCVEPSLHRSVLICNTLRHIEQEIRNEDEVDESLKSRERLPSFWGSSPHPNPPGPNQSQNNCFPAHPSLSGTGAQSSQPQITDSRPGLGLGLGLPLQSPGTGIPSIVGGAPMLPPPSSGGGGHDPYLTPNPYSEAPYLSAYDYNSPRPTPFHTTSYDYETDLLLPPPPNASPSSTAPSQSGSQNGSILLSDVTSGSSSLLECDSGYSDDLDMNLSSYYYASPLPPPVPPSTGSHPASLHDHAMAMSGASSNPVSTPTTSTGAIQVSSLCNSSSSTTNPSGDCTPYLPCPTPPPSSFNHVPPPPNQAPDPLLQSHEHHLTSLQPPPMEISDMSDISEIRNQTSTSSSPTSSSSSSCGGASSCEYTMASSSKSSSTPSPPSSTSTSSASKVEEQDNKCTSPSTSPPHQSSSPPHHHSHCNGHSSSPPSPSSSPATSPINTFAQQDSQCGLESRRSDLSRNVGNHYNNHNLPMDSLISPAYSSSSL